MKKLILASVVIPCKDRQKLMERAVENIIKLDSKNITEIIVIDDGSEENLYKPFSMRSQDRIIRLPTNVGGAVSRNIGISESKGKVIYLLDSDDYFIERNFEYDVKYCEVNYIYYGDVILNNKKSEFPEIIELKNYFKFIFNDYPYITQTSTLLFHKDTKISFDEDLPKHQDWDLVLYALKKGIKLRKYNSLTYIDRSDNNSVSRSNKIDRSTKWLNKISKDSTITVEDKFYIILNTNMITSKYHFLFFFILLLKFLFVGKINFKVFLLAIIKRYKFSREILKFFHK